MEEKDSMLCQRRSMRIGACPDTGYWLRSGIDPIAGVRKLGRRLLTIQPHDLNELSPQGHDVPWGTGQARFAALVREVHRLGTKPTLFGLEYSHNYRDNMAEMSQSIEFFNRLCTEIAHKQMSQR